MAAPNRTGAPPGREGPGPLPELPDPSGSAPADRFDLVVLAPRGTLSQAQILATYAGATAVEAFETKGGAAGQRMRRIIEVHERILRALDGRAPATTLPGERELARYGTALFETLFPGDVRRLWDAARARPKGRPLDVVFTSALDWVADKPWELAFDPSRKSFVAAGEVGFVRNVFSPVPPDPPRARRGPLRLLVATARPHGTPPLAAEDEERSVREAFAPLVDAGAARIDVLPRATPEALHRAVASSRIDVLHFVGHGEFDEKERTGALLLEDGKGRPKPLEAGALARLLAGRGILLAVLNACETGRGGRTDFLRGVAPALLSAGLPAVAANQYRVLDDAAAAFVRHFAWALSRGFPVSAAFREARVGVHYSVRGALDWAVPVLYARDPAAVLCRPAS
ncbi:MAG TPA: CHAT domain-containing protein [Thermoanaerobaculia bacterium]|nr:CHAT domain-containing protein [Thermoanaerobaculia bacterium]